MSPDVRIDLAHMGNFSLESIEGLLESIRKAPPPAFTTWSPDVKAIKEAAKGSSGAKDIIVIGHGGSITTLKGLAGIGGLNVPAGKRLHIIDTVDPAFIEGVLSRTAPGTSHVIAVSWSGSTMTVLEALSVFRGYPTTVVTGPSKGPLSGLAEAKGWGMVRIPEGAPKGRFSGGTAQTLLSACALGLDIDAFLAGLKKGYSWTVESGEVLKLSAALYLKERVGYRTLFLPVYSKRLSAFNELLTQLVHETLGKDRKGLTALCCEGPECQHHTMQRILEGPEDVMALLISVPGRKGPALSWEGRSGEVPVRDRTLSDLNGSTLGRAMDAELSGTMGAMRELELPFASLELSGESMEDLGLYVGIWHYIAYYSALLRKVEPFDQPAVQRGKELSFANRFAG